MKFQIFKLDVRKGRGPRDQIATGSLKKQENFRKKNIYFSLIDYAKVFDCVDHNKLWKILQEVGIPDHLTCLLRNLYAGQEATELDMEQQTGSKLEKDFYKAIYCHPAYLTSMQSTSCKMPDWVNHTLETRSPGEISTPQICR